MPLSKMSFDEKPYILAVDDEPMNRFLLEDIIEDSYDLLTVDNGQACLTEVDKRTPDLVLLDVNMPGMSGFEVCEKLNQNPATSNIPVIFLTAMMSSDDERKGFDVGAVDYITKPFTESTLLARLKTHLNLNQARKIIEKSHQALQSERHHIEQIISSMRKDDRFVHENLAQLVSPIEESNGDIVLSAVNKLNHHQIIIGDFTGHGLNAAMAGPLVSSLFYTQTANNSPTIATLEMINNELLRKLPAQNFLAAIYLDWDKNHQRITVWNFGMPDVVVFHADGSVDKVNSMSVALGVLSCDQHASLPTTLEFKEGDKLFAYSDGIIEVMNEQGKQFGDELLLPMLEQVVSNHLAIEDVADTINEFADSVGIKDDITLVQLCAHYDD